MELTDLEKLKYPVGKFSPPPQISKSDLDQWISELAEFPVALESLVGNLSR